MRTEQGARRKLPGVDQVTGIRTRRDNPLCASTKLFQSRKRIVGKSLVQFIIEEQRAIPGVSGNFTGPISHIIMACKQIAHDVS